MGTDNKKSESVRLNGRDDMLGKLLAENISDTGDPATCPDAELLGRFIDAAVSPGEHAAVVSHIAACGRCASTVAEVIGVRELHQSREQRARLRRCVRVAVPLALSAAAAAIFFMNVTVHKPDTGPAQVAQHKPSGPEQKGRQPATDPIHEPPGNRPARDETTVGKLVARLAGVNKPPLILDAAGRPDPAGYGFSSARTASGAAFQAGVLAADLDIAERCGDRDLAIRLLNRTALLLGTTGERDRLGTRLRATADSIATDRPLPPLRPLFVPLERHYIKAKLHDPFMLGAWAECGRIAATLKSKAYFNDQLVQSVGRKGLESQSEKEMKKLLEEIDRRRRNADYRGLELDFERLITLGS